MLTDACEGGANIASSPAPTTIEDILTAINMLGSRVNMRFTELNGVISDLRAGQYNALDGQQSKSHHC